MELEHKFTVAAPVEQAWEVLLDLERVAPCMPGATLTSYEGDEFAGNVRVKLGPVLMTFAGQGRFVERDAEARRMVIEASGKDKRGGGTARATVRSTMHGEGDTTTVEVHTDLAITGRAAQFGRGMIADVSSRLLGQFTDCLAGKLAAAPEPGSGAATAAGTGGGGQPEPDLAAPSAEPAGAAAPAGEPAKSASATPAAAGGGQAAGQPRAAAAPAAQPPAQVEPIDLLGVTGVRSTTRRLLPYLIVFLAGALIGGGIIALLVG